MRLQPHNRLSTAHQGQVTVEVAIALFVFIAALLAMRVYLQRAIQGNSFQGAMSVGQPFDPNDRFSDPGRYTETSTSGTPLLPNTDNVVMVPSHSMFEGENFKILNPWTSQAYFEPTDGFTYNWPGWGNKQYLANRWLADLPTGPTPREPAGWGGGVQQNSRWNNTGNSVVDVRY